MNPTTPPKSNSVFHAPQDGYLDHTQVMSIHAFKGEIAPGFSMATLEGEVPPGSNLDGARFVVTAWKPTPEDLETLVNGGLVYLSCLSVLPPHFLTTNWETATYGQG